MCDATGARAATLLLNHDGFELLRATHYTFEVGFGQTSLGLESRPDLSGGQAVDSLPFLLLDAVAEFSRSF